MHSKFKCISTTFFTPRRVVSITYAALVMKQFNTSTEREGIRRWRAATILLPRAAPRTYTRHLFFTVDELIVQAIALCNPQTSKASQKLIRTHLLRLCFLNEAFRAHASGERGKVRWNGSYERPLNKNASD